MLTYISPRAHRIIKRTAINTIDSLEGVTVGLFNNSKPNAAAALDLLMDELEQRFSVGGVIRDSKPIPSSPAEQSAIESMANATGAVIYATAD